MRCRYGGSIASTMVSGNGVGVVKQDRARVTYERILAGAARVFGEHGYERAKLNEIVDAAGITRGALYFHFQAKEDVAAAVIERQHELSMEAAAGIAASGARGIEQLVMVCREMGRQIVEDPIVRAGIRLTLEQSASEGPAAPYEGWISVCEQATRVARVQGDLNDWVDPREFATYMISSFTGVQLVANVLTGRADLDDRIDSMWKFLLPSIASPHAPDLEAVRAARWAGPDA